MADASNITRYFPSTIRFDFEPQTNAFEAQPTEEFTGLIEYIRITGVDLTNRIANNPNVIPPRILAMSTLKKHFYLRRYNRVILKDILRHARSMNPVNTTDQEINRLYNKRFQNMLVQSTLNGHRLALSKSGLNKFSIIFITCTNTALSIHVFFISSIISTIFIGTIIIMKEALRHSQKDCL